jgi:thiaminase
MLTEYLLALDPESYHAATHHRLLIEIGNLEVTPQHLSSWIVEDKFYTSGYIRMLETMLSRFPQKKVTAKGSVDPTDSLYSLLSFAHENIIREANFFQNLLARYNIVSDNLKNMRPLTKQYTDFQQKVAEESDEHLGEALVLLWAMERVFFDAWSHAKSLLINHPPTGNESSHIKTIRELVENWSSEEFEQFVDECAKQVNNLSMCDSARLTKYERIYHEMLGFEQQFWDLAYDA